jgi:hypothetical protein
MNEILRGWISIAWFSQKSGELKIERGAYDHVRVGVTERKWAERFMQPISP